MYKKYVSSILVVALLNLCGCYSYTALSKEEMKNIPSTPTSTDKFVLVLKDGSEIEYNTEEDPEAVFVRVDEPSDFIFGSGSIFDKKTGKESIFGGKIDRKMIDSSKIVRTGNEVYHLFWVNNNTRVAFKTGKYFNVKPKDGAGYFLIGKRGGTRFEGKIDFADISEIQKKEKNEDLYTIGIVVGVLAIFFLAYQLLKGLKGLPALNN